MTKDVDRVFKIQTNFWDITKSIGVLFIIGFLFFNIDFIKSKINLNEYKIDKTEIIKIAENAVKVQLEESNNSVKELIKVLKDQNSVLLNDIKKNKEKIDEIGVVVGKLGSNVEQVESSIVQGIRSVTETHDYAQIMAVAADGNKFPIADVRYHPFITDESKWVTNAYPLNFKTNIVMTTDTNGRLVTDGNRYIELLVNNDYVLGYEDKWFPLKIENVDWSKRVITDKKFGFNFRLGLSSSISFDYICPALDASLFSYGRTYRDIDWRFLIFSAGGNEDLLCAGLTPASWNLGNYLPIIENFFIGPSVFIDTNNITSYGLDVSIPF